MLRIPGGALTLKSLEVSGLLHPVRSRSNGRRRILRAFVSEVFIKVLVGAWIV